MKLTLLSPPYWLPWIAILFTAVMSLFSFTPLAWNLAGRPNESYPELVYFGFGIPAAGALLVASGIVAWVGRRRTKATPVGLLMLVLGVTLVALPALIMVFVALATVWPAFPTFPQLIDKAAAFVMSWFHFGFLAPGMVLVIVGGVVCLSSPRHSLGDLAP